VVSPDSLAEALAAWPRQDIPALPGRTNHKHAGVLLPVAWATEGPVVFATLRAARLREHAGEVSFPGGKPEPGDADLTDTALREAHEEIGLDRSRARVLGALSSMPLFTSDYRLVPTVAAVPDGPWRPDPGEVAAMLRVPLLPLLEAPALDALPWAWEGSSHHSPVFVVDGHIMFGATAHSLYELLRVFAGVTGRPLPAWRTGRFMWGGRGVVPV
jgi:8-oxo-dGTP pyrophosphatase MutT (NUDIX family)